MPTSILSTKGQLVIPKEIREFLGLESGDRIDFVVEADGRVSLRPALVDFRELRGLLSEGRQDVSVEEMNQAIRRRAAGGGS
jgi:antitoxin PrlF